MSWMFGVIGSSVSNDSISRSRSVHSEALGTCMQEGKYYIAAGGLAHTCALSHPGMHSNCEAFAITLGCPVLDDESGFSFLASDDWGDSAERAVIIDKLEGHFVHLSFAHDTFTIRNDRLGLRTLHWYETPHEVVISTRLEWIARYLGGLNIDYSALGSRWLIFNQLTHDSPVAGARRLGPAGRLSIGRTGVTSSYSPFSPSARNTCRPEEITDRLSRMVNQAMDGELRISLGLSGGVDSRVLLSFLLASGKNRFSTHTFGDVADPDVAIPLCIAHREGFAHAVHDAPLTDAPSMIALVRDYVAQTNLIEPASTVLRLRHYGGLDSSKFMLMDGGFGEVARRQYLNRLAMNGAKTIRARDVDALYGTLRAGRGDIFNSDAQRVMQSGVYEEILCMLDSMPDVSKVGIENYLDLWAVRTRLPNYSSDAQASLDATIANFMPFAQSGFVDAVLSLPVMYRKNGRLFRDILSMIHPPLTRYPLVKNATTYPFFLPTYGSWLWSKTKVKFGCHYRDHSIHLFLGGVKELILDLLDSRETVEYGPYNYRRIQANVLGYYGGELSLSKEVDWWLTFELWRRTIESHS